MERRNYEKEQEKNSFGNTMLYVSRKYQSMKISANDVATQEEIDVVVKNDGQAVKASDINTSIT